MLWYPTKTIKYILSIVENVVDSNLRCSVNVLICCCILAIIEHINLTTALFCASFFFFSPIVIVSWERVKGAHTEQCCVIQRASGPPSCFSHDLKLISQRSRTRIWTRASTTMAERSHDRSVMRLFYAVGIWLTFIHCSDGIPWTHEKVNKSTFCVTSSRLKWLLAVIRIEKLGWYSVNFHNNRKII